MTTLTTKQRAALPKSMFAVPETKAYPIVDASHAANAKGRATQQVKAGNISPSTKAKIDAAANKVLKKGK